MMKFDKIRACAWEFLNLKISQFLQATAMALKSR